MQALIFGIIGGLGLFLFGMKLLSEGFQKLAGTKLRQILKFLTNKTVIGVLTGAVVTAVVQSSSATTVMVVGFVNAGLLALKQAIGVILGANIGTTITAQLASIGTNITARRAALAHTLFNVIGAGYMLVFIYNGLFA